MTDEIKDCKCDCHRQKNQFNCDICPCPPEPTIAQEKQRPTRAEDLETSDDYGTCGNPSNHNNGDNSGCIECGILRNNL